MPEEVYVLEPIWSIVTEVPLTEPAILCSSIPEDFSYPPIPLSVVEPCPNGHIIGVA